MIIALFGNPSFFILALITISYLEHKSNFVIVNSVL